MNPSTVSHLNARASSGFSVTALVLGIISVSTGIFYIFSIPTGVVAIVFAAISLKRRLPGRPMAIAGLITGIAGLAFGLLIFSIILASRLFEASQMPATV